MHRRRELGRGHEAVTESVAIVVLVVAATEEVERAQCCLREKCLVLLLSTMSIHWNEKNTTRKKKSDLVFLCSIGIVKKNGFGLSAFFLCLASVSV